MEKSNMDEGIQKLINDNKLNRLDKGLVLTNWQISVLIKCGINPNNYATLKELIFDLNDILNSDDVDSDDCELLEQVAIEISDENYYQNTNK